MRETSRSLRGTAKDALVFSPKDRIDNPHFGLGTIVSIDTHYVTIKFDESGARKFVRSMVELVPSDTPKPARCARTRKKVNPESV